jgi:hypothetical protein
MAGIGIVYNVTCTNANTQYSQALPVGTTKILLRARGNGVLKVTYTTGETASKYFSVKQGEVYSDDQVFLESGASTVYFETPTAGEVVELLAWT